MERTRATWTDERLDDLAQRMDRGFSRIDEDVRTLRSDMNARFDSMERRMDSFQTAILQLGGGMTVAILATLVSVLLTRA